jgi:acetylornithine deacetylase/succinyl-diaminopimelate desuccinylase-like protein
MRAASAALQETFGKPAILRLFGASVPVVSMAQQTLAVDAIMLGFAILSEANAHSPNEHTHLPSYYRGTEAYVRFFEKFAAF